MRSLSKAARETRDKRKQYVKYQEGAELYSMGVSRFKQMAHECESVIKVGKSAWDTESRTSWITRLRK